MSYHSPITERFISYHNNPTPTWWVQSCFTFPLRYKKIFSYKVYSSPCGQTTIIYWLFLFNFLFSFFSFFLQGPRCLCALMGDAPFHLWLLYSLSAFIMDYSFSIQVLILVMLIRLFPGFIPLLRFKNMERYFSEKRMACAKSDEMFIGKKIISL